ncbi:hypothetical protein K504DRAFT_372718 [Pleomassaria siparia CBS 279.74]|uniref:Uncharacterized protein n=1 Tax=Pleomassaria siparia CBS 279.74 TaxID=1314801 RepID=A0A6G1KJJ3_9PLEO|nr:hypothetical protein K504DRAFT_372718 [Pleomassaria siparia CBS 279.74]
MERTPSPTGRRLNTPPAPKHGYDDSYQPYSLRKSTRVASQRSQMSQSPGRSRISRTVRDVTPTSVKKPRSTTLTAASFTLSPPASPTSPHPTLRSPRSTRRAHFQSAPLDSDSDHVAPTPARRHLSAMNTRGMLPTPAKTPQKRVVKEETLSSTARVLFPTKPATIEDAMPTPRKSRKNRKDVFTLESFAEQMSETENIEIYTDSNARIPTRDDEEENPFITKKGKGKARATTRARKTDAKTQQMEEAVNRDKGMIYLFRGKKIFRKFHDGPPSNASDNEAESSADELRRHAGPATHQRLTRSSIKPRLLFKEEIQQQKREMGPDDVDEEAVTDIEAPPIATPSRRSRKTVGLVPFEETTPPPTVKPKREISFDSWTRVKSSNRESNSSRESKKRSGDLMESTAEKRTRSEHSTAMDIDS